MCKHYWTLWHGRCLSSQPSDADPPSCKQLQLQSYKLVGDNIDKSVKARYMRFEGGHNKSLHYFHYFAVLNRVDFSAYPDVRPDLCLNSPMQIALSLLPSTDDDITLKHLFMTHISRVLCTHIPFFKSTFEDVVEWHIVHRYYGEMSTKSQVVRAFSVIPLSITY